MSKNKSASFLTASLSIVAAFLLSSAAFAADKPATDKSVDAAKAAYPLMTCVVSGDKLEPSSMGGPVDYIYKEKGQPDRLVRFCCKDCVKDFEKEPAKYLKKIDDAAVAKAKEEPAHAAHQH